jgi:hypothetical protein
VEQTDRAFLRKRVRQNGNATGSGRRGQLPRDHARHGTKGPSGHPAQADHAQRVRLTADRKRGTGRAQNATQDNAAAMPKQAALWNGPGSPHHVRPPIAPNPQFKRCCTTVGAGHTVHTEISSRRFVRLASRAGSSGRTRLATELPKRRGAYVELTASREVRELDRQAGKKCGEIRRAARPSTEQKRSNQWII